jgi:type II restriction enzyme
VLNQERFQSIVQAYKHDQESVYQTWFIDNAQRLKAFRAIRHGVEQVIKDVKSGSFGNDFKGSSLEVVLNSITEQKQVFEGAAHAFYWKPKLRIPDIYENEINKRYFAQFLENCLNANREEILLREILTLSEKKIKGLGPAAANIIYFLHPTLVPPFNTAILNGFNILYRDNKKLGSWSSFLNMRATIIQTNEQFKNLLSKDLGAISGLLFEIGSGKLVVEENADAFLDADLKKRLSLKKKRHEQIQLDIKEEQSHTEMQYRLVKIGKALGYDVIVAANDRSRSYDGESFSFHCLCNLPALPVDSDIASTIGLIDVLWFEASTNKIVCAFEVEKSTSIYSGILRLSDLAISLPQADMLICLVAPNGREKEVVAQLIRPAFAGANSPKLSYILFNDLRAHCDSICRLGSDFRILQKIAKNVSPTQIDVTL